MFRVPFRAATRHVPYVQVPENRKFFSTVRYTSRLLISLNTSTERVARLSIRPLCSVNGRSRRKLRGSQSVRTVPMLYSCLLSRRCRDFSTISHANRKPHHNVGRAGHAPSQNFDRGAMMMYVYSTHILIFVRHNFWVYVTAGMTRAGACAPKPAPLGWPTHLHGCYLPLLLDGSNPICVSTLDTMGYHELFTLTSTKKVLDFLTNRQRLIIVVRIQIMIRIHGFLLLLPIATSLFRH